MAKARYPADFRSEVAAGKVRPVYVLAGGSEEDILDAVGALKKAILAPGVEAFNYASYDGKESSAEEVLGAARTRPLGPGGRLVVLREPRALPDGGWEPLLAYLADPEPGNCLVVADELDWKSAPYRAAAAAGALIDFRPPPWLNRSQAVSEALRARGLSADREALRTLEAVLPEDSGLQRRELEKIDLLLGERRRVTAADLRDILVDWGGMRVFDMTDRISAGDRAGALRSLERLLEEGMDPIYLVSMLARQFRLLAMAATPGDFPELTRLPPKVREPIAAAAAKFDRRRLEEALRSLRDVDRILKSSPLSPAFLLDAFLAGMLPPR